MALPSDVKIKSEHGWGADCQFGCSPVFMVVGGLHVYDGVAYRLVECYLQSGDILSKRLSLVNQ